MNLEVDERSISTNHATPLVNKTLGANVQQRPTLGARTPNLRADQVKIYKKGKWRLKYIERKMFSEFRQKVAHLFE